MTTQFLRPTADSVDGGWTNELDGTTLFSSIDETSASDADYIKSSASPSADTCKIKLASPVGAITTPMVVSYRFWKTGASTIDLTVRLLQGSTIIASKTESAITETHTDGTLTLTAPQFAAITDFTNLYLELVATIATSGDPATLAWVAAVITNGGTVSAGRQTLVNDLVLGLKSDGIFGKLFRLFLFAGENQPQALTDIIAPGLATAVGTPGFAANAGFTGGTSKYIDSNANATEWDANFVSRSWFVWPYNNTPNTGSVIGSEPGLTQPVRGYLPYTDGKAYWRLNYSDTDEQAAGAGSNTRGLWVASAADATLSATLYRNGAAVDVAGAHSTHGTLEKMVFLANSGGITGPAPEPYTDVLSIGGFGQYLTALEVSNLTARLTTFMTGIGALDAYRGPRDAVPVDALGWYGLRAYSATTIGNKAVRLRETGGNTEQDFVTIAGGGLNLAAIATFKGANALRVVKLYDQSGMGWDVGNPTAAEQPEFLLNGIGSLPAIKWTLASSQNLYAGTGVPGHAQPVTLHSVVNFSSATGAVSQEPTYYGLTPNAKIGHNGTGGFYLYQGASYSPIPITRDAWHSCAGVFNGATSDQSIDGVSSAFALGTTAAIGTGYIILGGGGGVGAPMEGKTADHGVWVTGLSTAQLAALHSNARAYYGAMDDPATTAWVAAVVANGGTVSAARKGLVDDLILGLKAAGVWAKLDRLWLFAGENQPSALTDLVVSELALVVGTVPFVADRGYTGTAGASGVCIDGVFNPGTAVGAKWTQNSAHISAWSNTSTGPQNSAIVGIRNPGPPDNSTGITPVYLDGKAYIDINSDNISDPGIAAGNSLGFYLASRTGASVEKGYKNGALAYSPNTPSQTPLVNQSVTFLALHQLGAGPRLGWGGQIAAGSCGGGLSDAEVANFHTRLQTYMRAIGPEPEVTAWAAAVVVNGGTVSAGRQTLVNNLVLGLKADGIWPKLNALLLFAGENEGAALTDLVNLIKTVKIGTPAFTADRGFTGNQAAGSHLNTNAYPSALGTPTTFSQDSSCAFGWSNTAGPDHGALFGCHTNTGIFTKFSDDGILYWNITGPGVTFSGPGDAGLYVVNRSAPSYCELDINGVNVQDNASVVSSALGPVPFYALVALDAGQYITGQQISCLGWGGSLTETQRVALYNRLRTYMTAVGVP